jgi:hypothetical protein
MTRITQRLLLLTMLLGGLAMSAAAQNSKEAVGAKKADVEKAVEPVKDKSKDKEPGTEKPNRPKLPPGTIIVSPDDLKSLPFWMIWSRWDEFQAMKAELAALKRQPKVERASACEMTGRLEADYITLRAEFAFATEALKSTVLLGLHGAQLT